MTATTDLERLAALSRAVDDAMRLPCEFPACSSEHRAPATFRILVRHFGPACEPAAIIICGVCRDALHWHRHEQMECPDHGALGYSVAAWWRVTGTV